MRDLADARIGVPRVCIVRSADANSSAEEDEACGPQFQIKTQEPRSFDSMVETRRGCRRRSSRDLPLIQEVVVGTSQMACVETQLLLTGVSNSVGGVKYFLSILIPALREEPHFALVESVPVSNQGSLVISFRSELSPTHASLRSQP